MKMMWKDGDDVVRWSVESICDLKAAPRPCDVGTVALE